jgi:alpha-beta hydrolase superfamily lysophospholipase
LPENQNLENQTFITSDGLTIYYNVYYTTNQSGGIVITSDTWNAQTASYPSEMKGMRNNYGFIAATLATRGKGNSQGSANAF